MTERRKLIVVSNRGPIAYGRGGGERIVKRGAGGLVTALAPLVSHHDVTWIASAITDEDRGVAAGGTVEETARDGSRYRLRLVAHPPEAYDLYYNVIANPALWFVQHGLWERKDDPERDLIPAWDEGYVQVNRDFADAVLEELEHEPDAAVFFHDYHLYVAPSFVHERRPDAALAHFTHIPWVGPDGWSVLPERIVREIHEGLLACDVAGFHTQRWRAGVPRLVPRPRARAGRRRVTAHPISIDAEEFESLAGSEPVLARERELVAERPEQLILRVDRTDPSKNVAAGLRGVRPAARAPPGACAAASACSPCSTRRGRTSPSTSRSAAGSRRRPRRCEARFPGALTLRIADDFPRVDRGVQAVRRAARERGHGRAEPRREGGAARQRARRRRCLICQRRRVRGARRVGRSGRSVRRRRQAEALEQALELGEDERAERPAGDPAPRPGARSRGVDRGAAGRSRPRE